MARPRHARGFRHGESRAQATVPSRREGSQAGGEVNDLGYRRRREADIE
jgi:hypothetical protein